jgi:2-dehydro-3-deoxyphosphogluconate aldolase / (4S)-4-hydroxy-2-oxoglutarate aldolase
MSVAPDRPPLPPELLRTRVVAVLRGQDPDRVVQAGVTLHDAGVTCLEVTFTTPRAAEAIARLRELLPDSAALGAGTVLDSGQAREALAAGATFLVSPAPCPDVVEAGVAAGMPVLPGAFTPGEVLAAWRSGASAVKVFPAASGGPGHVRDLRAPLPFIPLIPTGGIGIDDAAAYLGAGAIAVGLGGSLTGKLDGQEGEDVLQKRARALLDALAGVPCG